MSLCLRGVGLGGTLTEVGLTGSLLRHWPRLHTLELVNCLVSLDHPTTKPWLPPNSVLTHLTLTVFVNAETLAYCLTGLPATLTHLAIDDLSLLHPTPHRDRLVTVLELVAPQLRALTLLDSVLVGVRSRAYPEDRGAFDSVVARSTAARRLAITPSALSVLSATVGKLPGLTELVLRAGATEVGGPLFSGELVDYLGRKTGVRRVSVNRAIWGKWSLEAWEEIDDLAEKNGVEFTYLD